MVIYGNEKRASQYGVYDPDCISAGNPAGCGNAGLRWVAPSEDGSSAATGSSHFDFNGDGRTEVIYNDQYQYFIFDGQTGSVLFRNPNSSRTRTEDPIVADVDSDGNAEIIFTANAEACYLRPRLTDPGVFIWGDARGRWVGARRISNQHAYHIENVTEAGLVPRRETPSWREANNYRQNLAERREEDHLQILDALTPAGGDAPRMVVAHTVKGKGCPEMENNPAWHHRIPSAAELEALIAQLK